MTYRSTKTFGHDLGISCAFRQWRATHSHCSKVHGYALSFHFVFEAVFLDECNWVMDFGGLKGLKEAVVSLFDHSLVVAKDDPFLDTFLLMREQGIADVVVIDKVGCEAFAELAYSIAVVQLGNQTSGRVKVISCECREHGANSAIYIGE